MKVLITGSNGLLGQHLVKLLLDKGCYVIATGRGNDRSLWSETTLYKYIETDITSEFALQDVMFAEKPDVIVHAAAITQVDECELNPDACFSTNVYSTRQAVAAAELYSQLLIYVSTDFVFDGEKGNYREEDAPGPVSWYGVTKLQAEQLVATCAVPWAIVRTCLVYGNTEGGTRNNIITWVKNKLEKKEPIKVVDDQVRTPTYVADLAKGIWLIIEKKATGIFHISGKDALTPYDMALQTAGYLGLDRQLIEKANATNFQQPAKRPPNTVFVIEKARKLLGYEPLSFEEGLKKMLR